VFPDPGALADAGLDGLGLTTARQRTLRALAEAAAAGRLNLDHGADPEEIAARLREVPGIGPWTIGYILMRAAADPDAFPDADLGLRRVMTRLGIPPGYEARWRPWRAYAAMHLWTWPAADGRAAGSQAAGSQATASQAAGSQAAGSQAAGSQAAGSQAAGSQGTGPPGDAVPASAARRPA
jgi:3-methyladenine DNA glycosylase/8-oxoguanine DNA glycosylase